MPMTQDQVMNQFEVVSTWNYGNDKIHVTEDGRVWLENSVNVSYILRIDMRYLSKDYVIRLIESK